MADIALRLAVPADADQIADIFLACWTTNYATVLPPEDIAGWDLDRARTVWAAHLANPKDKVRIFVDCGTVRGLIRSHIDGSTGTIDSLYVDAAASGRGIGRRLVEAACEEFTTAGCASVKLWVFETNLAARGFYERLGFAPDGRRQRETEYTTTEIGMARPFIATEATR